MSYPLLARHHQKLALEQFGAAAIVRQCGKRADHRQLAHIAGAIVAFHPEKRPEIAPRFETYCLPLNATYLTIVGFVCGPLPLSGFGRRRARKMTISRFHLNPIEARTYEPPPHDRRRSLGPGR